MIFANKQDIQGSMSSTEIRDVRPINNLPPFLLTCASQALDLDSIRSHQWRILPCSAVTGQNLIEGLDWVVGDVAAPVDMVGEGWRAEEATWLG